MQCYHYAALFMSVCLVLQRWVEKMACREVRFHGVLAAAPKGKAHRSGLATKLRDSQQSACTSGGCTLTSFLRLPHSGSLDGLSVHLKIAGHLAA